MANPSRIGRLRTVLAPYGAALLDLVYPPLCLGCDGPVPDGAQPLCHRCLGRLERADDTAVHDVLAALPDHDVLDGAAALWLFDKGGALQRVQHALKYGNRPRYGVLLGRLLAEHRPPPAPVDAVVPVPLHRARLLERGYNQSAALGRGVADVLGVPHRDALARPRVTRSQTRLDREARRRNVHDAFAVPRPEVVHGATLLLVDDVLTTGATAVAAARTLHAAGAAGVHLLTLALARH